MVEKTKSIREDTSKPLILETRAIDPDNPRTGRIWYNSSEDTIKLQSHEGPKAISRIDKVKDNLGGEGISQPPGIYYGNIVDGPPIDATKNETFKSDTEPPSASTGDFWIDTSGDPPYAIKEWHEGSWRKSSFNNFDEMLGNAKAEQLLVEDWIPDPNPSWETGGSGEICWNNFGLNYLGTTYNIPAGTTSSEAVWFDWPGSTDEDYVDNPSAYLKETAKTDFEDAETSGDAMLCINNSGTPEAMIPHATLISGKAIRTDSITSDEIKTGTLTAEEIYSQDWNVNEDFNITNHPSSGYVSWPQFELGYRGENYTINNGSADETYVWWDYDTDKYNLQKSNTKPSLDYNDAIIIRNEGGTGYRVLHNTLIHGDTISTGSINTSHLRLDPFTSDPDIEEGKMWLRNDFGELRFAPDDSSTETLDFGASENKYAFGTAPPSDGWGSGDLWVDTSGDSRSVKNYEDGNWTKSSRDVFYGTATSEFSEVEAGDLAAIDSDNDGIVDKIYTYFPGRGNLLDSCESGWTYGENETNNVFSGTQNDGTWKTEGTGSLSIETSGTATLVDFGYWSKTFNLTDIDELRFDVKGDGNGGADSYQDICFSSDGSYPWYTHNDTPYEETITVDTSSYSGSQEIRFRGSVGADVELGKVWFDNLRKKGKDWVESGTKSEVGATVNADYYVSTQNPSDYDTLSDIPDEQEGDIALVDEDSDSDYDNIYICQGQNNWQKGGTISEIGATINADYYVSSAIPGDYDTLSDIPNEQKGDIALVDSNNDEDYDDIYVCKGENDWKHGATRNLKNVFGNMDDIEDGDTWVRIHSGNTDGNGFIELVGCKGDLGDIDDDDADGWGKVDKTYLSSGGALFGNNIPVHENHEGTKVADWGHADDVTEINGGVIHNNTIITTKLNLDDTSTGYTTNGTLWFDSPDLKFYSGGNEYAVDKTALQPADTLHYDGVRGILGKSPTPGFGTFTPSNNETVNFVTITVSNQFTSNGESWEIEAIGEYDTNANASVDVYYDCNVNETPYNARKGVALTIMVPAGGHYDIHNVTDDPGNASVNSIYEMTLKTV